MRVDVDSLLFLIREAGQNVLSVYHDQKGFELKDDRSPLTEADRLSHKILSHGLLQIDAGIPILSEEGESVPYEVRKHWESYFLIDPLDGTKGFIRHTDEFTVNIALIYRGEPVLGLIHSPVSGVTYLAEKGSGSFRISHQTDRLPLENNHTDSVRVLMSRDDDDPVLQRMLGQMPNVSLVRTGCSIKFAMVAEGTAEFYPRRRGSMEWDTAAGAVLVTEAGGTMIDESGSRLCYNRENLLNPPFFVFSHEFTKKVVNWREIIFKV